MCHVTNQIYLQRLSCRVMLSAKVAPEALLEQLVSAAGDVRLEIALRRWYVKALGAVPPLGRVSHLEISGFVSLQTENKFIVLTIATSYVKVQNSSVKNIAFIAHPHSSQRIWNISSSQLVQCVAESRETGVGWGGGTTFDRQTAAAVHAPVGIVGWNEKSTG